VTPPTDFSRPIDLRELDADESDPNWGIADLEWRYAAFIEALMTAVTGHGEDRRRFIAVALRGYLYRRHIDVHRPELLDSAGVTMTRSLPPEWHEAWLWGYQWQPAPLPNEKTGSAAILDAVSPSVRAGILENLAELGIEPRSDS
jgi:hypothetical protein